MEVPQALPEPGVNLGLQGYGLKPGGEKKKKVKEALLIKLLIMSAVNAQLFWVDLVLLSEGGGTAVCKKRDYETDDNILGHFLLAPCSLNKLYYRNVKKF